MNTSVSQFDSIICALDIKIFPQLADGASGTAAPSIDADKHPCKRTTRHE